LPFYNKKENIGILFGDFSIAILSFAFSNFLYRYLLISAPMIEKTLPPLAAAASCFRFLT
jgi:hypothetical protein